jgi:hypothetical protein
MTRIRLSLGILATVVLIAGPGLAQRQADPEAMFERLDQDGDGVVTFDEVPDEQKERFDRILSRSDQDQDGQLTREEFMAVREQAPSRQERRQRGGRRFDPEMMFERMDGNGDGTDHTGRMAGAGSTHARAHGQRRGWSDHAGGNLELSARRRSWPGW